MGISNTQYRDIMFQYDQTRMNNQRILDKRYETLFVEIPELEQIQHDIMDLSLTQARKELFQTEPDPKSEAEYSAKREALLSRKKALLLHHGYPEDYLQSIYTCPDAKTPAIRTTNLVTALKTLRSRLFMKVQILWTF
jgi:DNA replication protein DnaC